MKKVGIITIFKVDNYGAELQAYATQKALQLMGYDAEIINYPYFVSPRHTPTKMSDPILPIPTKLRLIKKFLPLINWYKTLRQTSEAVKIRKRNFESFHSINTKQSAEYRTMEALYSNANEYDAYVVGSDQVWNPFNNTSLDPYFLKFAPKGKVRFSYASSFGVSKLPEYGHQYYCEALNGLDSIGVREENAVEIVKNVSGCEAIWVLDPTLLLCSDEWNEVAYEYKPVSDHCGKYVLLYELTPCPYLKQLAFHVAKEKGLNIVRINKDTIRVEQDRGIINVMDAGPAEFLWLFKNASFVVTNSFHGTAFSINFNKNFYVVTPARKDNNSRQRSILRLFNLQHRLMLEGADFPESGVMDVDFMPVNQKLAQERLKCKNFIKHSIDGEL